MATTHCRGVQEEDGSHVDNQFAHETFAIPKSCGLQLVLQLDAAGALKTRKESFTLLVGRWLYEGLGSWLGGDATLPAIPPALQPTSLTLQEGGPRLGRGVGGPTSFEFKVVGFGVGTHVLGRLESQSLGFRFRSVGLRRASTFNHF